MSIILSYFYLRMKILAILALLMVSMAVRPPQPSCRVSPLPSMIPISIGETLRMDLQDVFHGFNLFFTSPNTSHINVTEKYTVTESHFDHSMNFTSAKLSPTNRFLGLITNNEYTGLAIGFNNASSGVVIEKYIQVEDIPNLHCYDVAEVWAADNHGYAVIDCGVFIMGELSYNEFLYVNLSTYTVVGNSRVTDTFVKYHQILKRRIQVIQDPFNRLTYLVRVLQRSGVDQSNRDKTYLEVFYFNHPFTPQLIDVIDHTTFGLPSLSISDFQIHMGFIYLLIYNKGLYQFRWTNYQRFERHGFFEIKNDIYQFHVDQLGFNDDLMVVTTNGNSIYQFQWDIASNPVLVTKYSLIPNSQVEEIFVDFNFVVVLAKSTIDTQVIRRTWIFTRRTLSYMNAYNVFPSPMYGPAIIHWDQHGTTLHIFHEYSSMNVKMSLPYLTVSPVSDDKADTTQEFKVSATSYLDQGHKITCEETFKFIYLRRNDSRIIKTGLMSNKDIYVDSPDERQIDLAYEFFGRNLTYNITFDVNSSILPYSFVDKQHKAIFEWPKEINQSQIVYLQMFTETLPTDFKPKTVYGFIQTNDEDANTTYYIACDINVMDRDETHHLGCRVIYGTRFGMGRILFTSQMFQKNERMVGIVFDKDPHLVMLYYFWPTGFGFYGRKFYGGVISNQLTAIAINKGMLFCVLEYGKRVDIFTLESLAEDRDIVPNVKPIMVLDSTVMRFFGIAYFAPVGITVSRYHNEVIFLKTKSGVIAININEQGFPDVLFQLGTPNILYDFQVNPREILIIGQNETKLYYLQTPLRRGSPPILRQTFTHSFKLGGYDQVDSDLLFYLQGEQDVVVFNPQMPSTSAFYTQVFVDDEVLDIDAINIVDKEILFVRTKGKVHAWVLAQSPKLFIEWHASQHNFTVNLSAYNLNASSQAYKLNFTVLQTNETTIYPSPTFNETQVKNLGHIQTDGNNASFTYTLPINDSQWFQGGSILGYHYNCSDCGRGKKIQLHQHVMETREIVQARAIYDMHSNYDGIFAQQYSSVFKTHVHNDSIQYIVNIPTQNRGQVCSKIAVGQFNEYVISLCQLGTQVNVYLTSLISAKPFTLGPYPTEAKAVNHAKIVGDILMIVDNDDDPFRRAGGVYLYLLDFDMDDDEGELVLLDYLDYQDLQIEGFDGIGYIGSADIHMPFFLSYTEYRIFITEGRSGNLFVFTFELSPDYQQIVYLSKKMVSLQKLMPTDLKYPTPLRILTLNIHYHLQHNDQVIEYYLIMTVSNWHHIQFMITLDQNDNILFFKVERLFERFPWTLQNYFRYKRSFSSETYFAVPYIDIQSKRQIISVFNIPFIIRGDAPTYHEKYSPHPYTMLNGVPLLRMLGAHRVSDIQEVAYAFNVFGQSKLLFTDLDGYNITQLTLNKNLTIYVNNLTTPVQDIVLTAFNPYSNISFHIQLDFSAIPPIPPTPDEDKTRILWICLVVIGALVIIGLLIAFARQRKRLRQEEVLEGKQSLLTVEEEFKNDYINNRTSVDPQSVRESADLRKSEEIQ